MTGKVLVDLYTRMLEIRLFEERVADLLNQGVIRCPTHLCIGQEAVSAGVCAALTRADYTWGTHRSHGPFIGKVREFDGLMAELLVKESGVSGGHGGSMHLIDRKKGFMGSAAIVAGTLPLAVGGGLALQLRRKKAISVAFFGDGATDEGVFYECLNLAALYRLPVLFVCENNLYSTHRRMPDRQAQQDLCRKVRAFGIKTERLDGNDALEVFEGTKAARAYILKERRPIFLEFMTYRWLSHVGASPDLDFNFRTRAEVESWMRRCPILKIEKTILEAEHLTEKQVAGLKSAISRRVSSSYRKAAGSR